MISVDFLVFTVELFVMISLLLNRFFDTRKLQEIFINSSRFHSAALHTLLVFFDIVFSRTKNDILGKLLIILLDLQSIESKTWDCFYVVNNSW